MERGMASERRTGPEGPTAGGRWALLAVAALIWGVQPTLIRMLVRELDPVPLTVIRFSCIAVILFCAMVFRGERILPPPRLAPALLAMGLGGVAVNNIAQFSGLLFSTAGNATLIAAMTPAITAALAALFLRERLLPIQWLGIGISLSGAVFLILGGSAGGAPSGAPGPAFNIGDALFLLSQLGWATYTLLTPTAMRHLSPLGVTAWAGLIGALLAAVFGMAAGVPASASLSWAGAGELLYAILLGGICATVFWNLGVGAAGPGRAAIFMNIMPLAGVLTGVIVLGEEFRREELVGALGILSGIFLLTQAERLARWRDARRRGS